MPPKPGCVSSRYTGVRSTTGGTTWRAKLQLGKSFPEQAWQRGGPSSHSWPGFVAS
jgi:hypothetical protein